MNSALKHGVPSNVVCWKAECSSVSQEQSSYMGFEMSDFIVLVREVCLLFIFLVLLIFIRLTVYTFT